MGWNFDDIIAFGQQFSGPEGTELAFVLSEWLPEEGLALTEAYPAVRENLPPTQDAPQNRADQVYVKLNGGAWQQVSSIANVTNIGLGTNGVLQSGITSAMVIKGWKTKNIAAGYIIAMGTTLDQINADREEGIALIRTYVNESETQPLAPSEPFTSGQVTVLSAWLNNHNISNAEFAALFDIEPSQLSNWLQTHPRLEFAKVINEKFN